MTEVFYLKCAKCGKELPECEIEDSHDIPKYIGGTDAEGIHRLCEDCHNRYEAMIMVRCWKLKFNQDITFWKDRRKNAACMFILKQYKEPLFKEIAYKIKKEFFDDTTTA